MATNALTVNVLDALCETRKYEDRHSTGASIFYDSGMEESDSEVYEIERLLDRRRRGRYIEYLIRWKGFGEEEDEWVREKDIQAKDLVIEYNRINNPKTLTRKSSSKANNAEPRQVNRVTETATLVKQTLAVSDDEEESKESVFTTTFIRPEIRNRVVSENLASGDFVTSDRQESVSVLGSAETSMLGKASPETAVVDSSSSVRQKDGGLYSLSVYDIPLVIFVSSLLLLLVMFVVQKRSDERSD